VLLIGVGVAVGESTATGVISLAHSAASAPQGRLEHAVFAGCSILLIDHQ